MTKATIEIQEETVEEKDTNSMVVLARKVLLAGIGAVALAQEEVEDFVVRLVDRGEIAEKDGRRLISDVLERRKKDVKKVGGRVSDGLEETIETVLHRMNIPTKEDINHLTQKINTLTKKVEELKKGEKVVA